MLRQSNQWLMMLFVVFLIVMFCDECDVVLVMNDEEATRTSYGLISTHIPASRPDDSLLELAKEHVINTFAR
jgi:hypothetical protein